MYWRLFERALGQCIEAGLVGGELILTDSTHVKANASRQFEVKVHVEKEAVWYMEWLDAYEEAARKRLEGEGKIKPKRGDADCRRPRKWSSGRRASLTRNSVF